MTPQPAWLAEAAWQVPWILIYMVAGCIAIARWRKHPQVSVCILAATILLLFQSVAGTAIWIFILNAGRSSNLSSSELGQWMAYLRIGRTILSACGWVLVLIAVFGWRHPPYRILGHDGQYLPPDFEPATAGKARP